MPKLRHYEKAEKFEKNLPPFLTKQLFSLKTSGIFFQIFVVFSEKLDFNRSIKKIFVIYRKNPLVNLTSHLRKN